MEIENIMFFWEIIKLMVLSLATIISIKVFTKQVIEKYFITQNAENKYLREHIISIEKRLEKKDERIRTLEEKFLKLEEVEIREIHISLSNVKQDVDEVKKIVERNSEMQERLYESMTKIVNALDK